jgi:ketosteroid isomerase-like protein
MRGRGLAFSVGAHTNQEDAMSNTLERVTSAYFDALNRSDPKGLASLFDDDGLAVVQTHSAGTLAMPGAGTTIENSDRELFVLRNAGDGWRITHDMFNSVENDAGTE